MKIEDDFIDQKDFDKLQRFMMGSDVAWYYNHVIDAPHLHFGKNFQFTHNFYSHSQPKCNFLDNLNPIINKIDPVSIWRIKANLRTKTPNIIETAFHVDMLAEFEPVPIPVPEEKLKQWTTSIFYMNTNNGYTKFEDGTKVESVANRFVTFPSNMKHTGTSCTDENTRVVINFNYFTL